ncbi:uncharacterized protein NFIA_036220 [Aspergillus fischeri NRRL 181]|uniref:Uncharacterized protein n=1 Tax=Neosartorya fischeri (strain ATCC 1020 / DSM 3700 / CBS 544.65 / FGSC A1164 / JCM 1740 / NRRL 181 / WB 181) TaxID=331117 RepID=A1CZ80_NEOFI|nr:uncharacterized protein NFIA_036220 [Aspergillus fischeri NRRL 181]EAW24050.1 hypothetical protein NFIA_036220 [Aspergillus fischeri NRRL 181]KAG2017097.1 hypothetical protein GB937_005694 [Aspergillus fischeri]
MLPEKINTSLVHVGSLLLNVTSKRSPSQLVLSIHICACVKQDAARSSTLAPRLIKRCTISGWPPMMLRAVGCHRGIPGLLHQVRIIQKLAQPFPGTVSGMMQNKVDQLSPLLRWRW